ncbi:hypothetical protein C0993_001728, partial [Termitomyces sp. T159_Od127]
VLPRTYEEVKEGMAVAVIFILGVWTNKNGNNTLLNIQDVVILADSKESKPEATSQRSVLLWVKDDEEELQPECRDPDSADDFV